MILYNTPLVMVLTFLGLTLLLGLYVSKKEITFREYAVGNKRFQTTTLMVTVLATIFGGGVLLLETCNIYKYGMLYIVCVFIGCINVFLISCMALRMGPFMEHLSVADTIGSIYGQYPRAIAAVLGICYSIGLVSVQINVMSYSIGMCIDSIDPRIVTILATLILIAYSVLGGVHAITITDILQFVTFMSIIALLIKFLFIKIDKSLLEIISLLKKEKKDQYSYCFQFNKDLFRCVLSSLINPSVIQRVYMSSSQIHAYKVFLRVTFFSLIIWLCITLIALFVFVKNPKLSTGQIWPYILNHMSPAYKGYLVICILGMTMSRADSGLQTAAIMISHDIVEIIRGVKARSSVNQLQLAKLATLVIGVFAMIIAVYYPDLFALSDFVFVFLITFFAAVVIPPFIFAVFGFRSSSRTALIGMVTGALIYLVWNKSINFEIGIYSASAPLLANGLAMMASHYLLLKLPGQGWIGPDQKYKRIQQLIRAFKNHKKRIDLE